MIKLVTGSEVAIQFFESVNPAWELFEDKHNGDLTIGGFVFSMRVGLHLQRPVQAIMGAGQFLRIRSAGRASGRTLKILDPVCPNKSLYQTPQSFLIAGETDKCWHPSGSIPKQPKSVKIDSLIFDFAPLVNHLTSKRR